MRRVYHKKKTVDYEKEFQGLDISSIRRGPSGNIFLRCKCRGILANGDVCGQQGWKQVATLRKQNRVGRLGFCEYCGKRKSGYLRRDGYKLVSFKGKTVMEHRLIMEKFLGRRLKRNETVHHGPLGRSNNSIENLSLRVAGNHPRGWSAKEMKAYLLTVPKRLGGLK